MGELDGWIVVVTGTSRGIGRALRQAFSAAGATVPECSGSSGTDVRREADIARFFGEITRHHGRIDVLINNAGVLTPRKPLAEVSTAEWDESMAVNLRAAFLCAREALPLMRHGGWIINISSGAGRRAAPGWGPYAVAKWGIEGLSLALASELEGTGIRVVSLNPGGTRTGMRALAYPEEDPQTVKPPADLAAHVVDLVAGRIEAAGVVLDYRPGDSG